MALAASDFDPTESAIPWKVLTEAGHEVVFATPDGQPARADERMVSGRGLSIFKAMLKARVDAVEAYALMCEDAHFQSPCCAYAQLGEQSFDGLLLPGGHAPGMKTYLESGSLQQAVALAFVANKPVGAICHGVIVAARSQDPSTGLSSLHGRKSTALPRAMELSAWALTCLWLGNYYRTYPETVEAEVRRRLADPRDFDAGPSSLLRDSPQHLKRGFVVRDGNYLSARWPGDAYRFAQQFCAMLDERKL